MDHSTLSHIVLRTAWIFQALAALPILVTFGIFAFVNLLSDFGPPAHFLAHMIAALLAAAIIFVVIVQWSLSLPRTPRRLTWRLEIAKSSLATTLWLWLVCDAAFGPMKSNIYYGAVAKTSTAVTSVILILLLFYPTVVLTTLDKRYGGIRLARDDFVDSDEGELSQIRARPTFEDADQVL